MNSFEHKFEAYMEKLCQNHPDPSHDLLHVKRVVATAKVLAQIEGADLNVVVPAAYLHDCFYISKSDSRRSKASTLSADKAMDLLKTWDYPEEYHQQIYDAIAAHSFSANITAETLEAKIVQDADRLDAMGAIGIFRCFAFSGMAKRPLYCENDPFCESRQPDDSAHTLDHFFEKLLHLQKQLNTGSAKFEGEKRLAVMKFYLDELKREINA